MEEARENGKESSHSAHGTGLNEWMNGLIYTVVFGNSTEYYICIFGTLLDI
jgi:hypothetical protein